MVFCIPCTRKQMPAHIREAYILYVAEKKEAVPVLIEVAARESE